MKFTMPLVPEAASVYLTLFLNDSDEERYELYLRLDGSYLSCQINEQVTVGCDYEENNWMVLFHDKRERFVSQRLVITQVGTRAAFAQGLQETSFGRNAHLCTELLDAICNFSKCLNLYLEPESFW
jgi:hypothetical protein